MVPQAAFADDLNYPPPPPPRSATIAAELTPACEDDVPVLYYTIAVRDPQGTIDATTATLAFTEGSNLYEVEVPLNSGKITWPGYASSGGVATAWPGYALNSSTGVWEPVGDDNLGWTRSTDVVVTVNPSVTLAVEYPAGDDCVPVSRTVEVVNETIDDNGVVVVDQTLSATGFQSTPLAVAGGVMLLAGAGVVVVAARRTANHRARSGTGS